MKKIYLLLLVFAFGLSGCEKDDICDANTPTTPRLVIDFYNASNPAALKNVTNLKVRGEGMTEDVILGESANGDPIYIATNVSRVLVPLKTLEDKTRLVFIFNSLSDTPQSDTLEFNYTRSTEYVSRACGFKTFYTLNATSNPVKPVILNDGNPGVWMQSFELNQTNIVNENEVHLKILF
jgi:hypothetical protein